MICNGAIELVGGIQLMVDNKSTTDLAEHSIALGRCKHIEVKFHFLRDQVNTGRITLSYCKTDDQAADVLTKPLKIEKFKDMRKMHVISLENLK